MKRSLLLLCVGLLFVAPTLSHASQLQGDYVLDAAATRKHAQTLINKLPAQQRPLARKYLQTTQGNHQLWLRFHPNGNRLSFISQHQVRGRLIRSGVLQGSWSQTTTGYRLTFSTTQTLCTKARGNKQLKCRNLSKRGQQPFFFIKHVSSNDPTLRAFRAYTSQMNANRNRRSRVRRMSAGKTRPIQIRGLANKRKNIFTKGLAREVLAKLARTPGKLLNSSREAEQAKLNLLRAAAKPRSKTVKKNTQMAAAFGVGPYETPSFDELNRRMKIEHLLKIISGRAGGEVCFDQWFLHYKLLVCGERQVTGKARVWVKKAEAHLFFFQHHVKLYDVPPNGKEILGWLQHRLMEFNNTLQGVENELNKVREEAMRFYKSKEADVLREISTYINSILATPTFQFILAEALNKVGQPLAEKYARIIADKLIKNLSKTLSKAAGRAVVEAAKKTILNSDKVIKASKIDSLVSLTVGVGIQLAAPPINVFIKCAPYSGDAKFCCIQRAVAEELTMLVYNIATAIIGVVVDAAIITPVCTSLGASIAGAITGSTAGFGAGVAAVIAPVATKILSVSFNTLMTGLFIGGSYAWDAIANAATVKTHINKLTGIIMVELNKSFKKAGMDLRKLPCIACELAVKPGEQCKGLTSIKPSTPTQVATNAPGYVGCFKDEGKRDLPATVHGSKFNPATCTQACAKHGYSYAGLQFYGRCYCGNTFGQRGAAPEDQCSYKCESDKGHLCGGSWRNSVYLTAPVLGCYADKANRDLGRQVLSRGALPNTCVQRCRSMGYRYAGLQHTGKCFCGNSYGKHGKRPLAECNLRCTAKIHLRCGGLWRSLIFDTRQNRLPTPGLLRIGEDAARHGDQGSSLYALQRKHTESFYVGPDGYLHYVFSHRGRWMLDKNTFRRGGKATGAVSAVFAPHRNHAEVFYVGPDRHLHYYFIHRGRWMLDKNTFRRGGPISGSVSAVYAPHRKHSEVFVRGPRGYLQHYYLVPNKGWRLETKAFRRGGQVEGPISAVYATHRRHAEVFYRGPNNLLHYFFLHGGRWHLDKTTFRRFPVHGDLAALYNPLHRHSEVFYRGRDGYLNRFFFHRGWHHDNQSWRSAGRVTGEISVVFDPSRKNPSGFFRGEDGYLRYFFYEGRERRWKVDRMSFRKGGKVAGSISASYSSKRRHTEVFFRGTDGSYRYFHVGPRGWTMTKLRR
ncbi:MAG: hypothetical protein EP343_09895 [Deltaproteobacteria bacterium]|nr:MAG: hypothetical protein EP343_09895 [Deltaproteobacteria bacterium]